jgi:hypothetical protein
MPLARCTAAATARLVISSGPKNRKTAEDIEAEGQLAEAEAKLAQDRQLVEDDLWLARLLS